MKLIVTADDLGYSKERNCGIMKCFRDGVVTTSSLLVNAVCCEDAVEQVRKNGVSTAKIGLHLNLSEGTPLCPPYNVPSLLGNDNYFLGKDGFPIAVKNGRIKMDEVQMEIEAQINKYKSLIGHFPVYVDGHQHVHVTGISEIFSKTLKKYGIKFTRQCFELDISDYTYMEKDLREFLSIKSEESQHAQHVFKNYDIQSPDLFVGLSTMGKDMTIERLKTIITKAFSSVDEMMSSNSVCEIMVHPGYATGQVGGCGDGPDSFSQSPDREHELRILTGEELKHFFKSSGFTLISYYDLITDK